MGRAREEDDREEEDRVEDDREEDDREEDDREEDDREEDDMEEGDMEEDDREEDTHRIHQTTSINAWSKAWMANQLSLQPTRTCLDGRVLHAEVKVHVIEAAVEDVHEARAEARYHP